MYSIPSYFPMEECKRNPNVSSSIYTFAFITALTYFCSLTFETRSHNCKPLYRVQ